MVLHFRFWDVNLAVLARCKKSAAVDFMNREIRGRNILVAMRNIAEVTLQKITLTTVASSFSQHKNPKKAFDEFMV